jgi:hypothetical protein
VLQSGAMRLWIGLALLAAAAPAQQTVRTVDVAPVWSGHRVGFAFLTAGNRQFAGFYDAQRRMTIASRTLDSDRWRFAVLASTLGWDSHNSIALAADRDGYLHVSGNMHASPLVYFRTSKPWDIDTFEAIHRMTGGDEQRVTYPKFFRGPQDELVFTYRTGGSGDGSQIYDRYDAESRMWKRLLDTPLTSNAGHVSAYFEGPAMGPDGWFHVIWVWRDTPDCATNHDLSYARSRDLVHWETSGGKALALPITTRTGEVVDPVPAHGGMLNGGPHLGFDSERRPVITYYKFDAKGLTQAYAARLEGGAWKIRQLSNWNYRWDPQGGGTIVFEVHVGAVRPAGAGELAMSWDHVRQGAGVWRLSEKELRVIGSGPASREWPEALDRPESPFPGMEVQWLRSGAYLLRWETLGPNRDRPRTGPLPEPSMLRVYELGRR